MVSTAQLFRYLKRRAYSTLQSRALILMYHRVLPCVEDDPFNLKVSNEHFDEHMAFLSSHYKVLSLEKLIDQLQRGRLNQHRAVTITFDDGYFDNYNYAFPVLKKYGLHATIFLATDYIEQQKPFNKLLKTGYIQENFADDNPLTWDQVREMVDSCLVSLGVHTASHAVMSTLSEEAAKKELRNAQKAIKKNTIIDAQFFAYPYGQPEDWNANTERWVQEVGFTCSLTTVRGVVKATSSCFALPRAMVRDMPAKDFAKFISKEFIT